MPVIIVLGAMHVNRKMLSIAVFSPAIRKAGVIPIENGHTGPVAHRGCARAREFGRECDFESRIPALDIGPPALPNQSTQSCHSRLFGTSSGHLLFLAS